MEKSKVIERLFEHIVTYSYLLLPLIFLFFKIKRKESYIIAIYGIIFFLLLFFYHDIPKENRKLYQTIYTFLEYFFFTILFYLSIETLKYKRLILLLSGFFVAFQIIYYLAFEKARVDSIPIGVESILIFIYIFLFFLESLNNPKEKYIYSNYCFWVSVGLLVYLGGSFFINILANSFTKEEFDNYWYLNYVADTAKTFLFAVALLFIPRKANNTKSQNASNVPYLDMI